MHGFRHGMDPVYPWWVNVGSDQSLDAQIDAIFDRALDLGGAERAAYLEEACGDNSELRQRVDRLLAFSDDPPSLLDEAVTADLWQPPHPAHVPGGRPKQVGPYRILRELGRGGMGVVYLGERADGLFDQQVAIKVTRPGTDSEEARRRFEQERQIIANLQHASIARLYDGGVTEDGRPYSVMELVKGQPIHAYCDERRLSIAERLRLMEVVGEAVHYAHQKLVVHCDLKPSNILVTTDGEIKLLDFGISRMLDACCEPDGKNIPITPLYASPEQLRGELVTTASDVYQLGLLLYELLTGERAREAPSSSGSGIRDESFARATRCSPSTAVRRMTDEQATAVAEARGLRKKALLGALGSELDLIVQAAMHSDPRERYASAVDLVEDLRRYRRSEPLSVHPDSMSYRVSRFVRRNRLAVAAAALFVALLVGYSVTVTLQAERIKRERDKAQRIQDFALELYSASDPDQAYGADMTAAQLVEHGVSRADVELQDEPEVHVEVKTHLANIYRRLGRYDEAEKQLREALAINESLFDETHPSVIDAKDELGRILLERDDPEALEILQSVLEERRRRSEADTPEAAQTLTRLGFYLRSAGRHEEAEEHFREALGVLRTVDPEGEEIAGTLGGLGWTVRNLGRPEEAEPLLRESLEIHRKHHGEQHSEVAGAWNNLASVLWQLEKWDEGDDAIRNSIDVKRALFGDSHPTIAVSLGNLAGSLQRRDEPLRAAELYRHALTMRRESLGESHPRVAQSLAQLAEALHEAGELDESKTRFEEALAMFGEHLPDDHPSFARTLRGMGGVLLDRGEWAEARRTLEKSRLIYAGMQDPAWPGRVDILLARVDRLQGNYEAAAARLAAAEEILQSTPRWLESWREEKELLVAVWGSGAPLELVGQPGTSP